MKEIIEISAELTSLLSAALKSRLINTIKGDFTEAITNEGLLLWKKIKPLFIEEDAKAVAENFEKAPDTADAQTAFRHFLTEALRKSPEMKDEVVDFLQKKPQGLMNQYINTINNSGSGDAIIGSKTVTNNYHTGQKE